MKKFILIMNDTPAEREVKGEDLNDACQKAGLTTEDLGCLDHFIDDDGKTVQVFCEANCGCVYHAEDGTTCIHDLARVGITYIAQSA